MILSDRSILQKLRSGMLEIAPLDDPGVQIQPCSVDLRLGPKALRRLPRGEEAWIDKNGDWCLRHWQEIDLADGPFMFEPGVLILGGTVERVKLPHDLMARVDGRSTWGRRGLLVHITAGLIDPGFNGQITLEMLNIGIEPIELRPGMRICQLVLEQLDRAVARPYGAGRGSTYTGEQTAPMAPPERDAHKPPSGMSVEDLWNQAMGDSR